MVSDKEIYFEGRLNRSTLQHWPPRWTSRTKRRRYQVHKSDIHNPLSTHQKKEKVCLPTHLGLVGTRAIFCGSFLASLDLDEIADRATRLQMEKSRSVAIRPWRRRKNRASVNAPSLCCRSRRKYNLSKSVSIYLRRRVTKVQKRNFPTYARHSRSGTWFHVLRFFYLKMWFTRWQKAELYQYLAREGNAKIRDS
jgi:hypothetical protein